MISFGKLEWDRQEIIAYSREIIWMSWNQKQIVDI